MIQFIIDRKSFSIYSPGNILFGNQTKMLLLGSLILIILIFLPISILRQYQHIHLGKLFNLYNSAEKEQLTFIAEARDDERIFFTLPNLTPLYTLQTDEMDPAVILPYTKYLVAEFLCEPKFFQDLEVKIYYKSNFERDPLNRSMDFTRRKTIALQNISNGKTKLFFPVYFTTRSRFEGIEISKAQAQCIAGIYKIKDISQFPFLLTLVLPPEWEKIKRYQISVD